jgi:glutathione S-transferase
MRLYDTQRSGNAWKVRLLAGLLGIGLERVTLSIDAGDLRSPAFLELNPLAQIPVLQLADGRAIGESMAILQYLANGTAYWPTDQAQQAQVLTWLSFEQSQHMRPLAQLRLHLALHRNRQPEDGGISESRACALRALALLDAQLGRQVSGWVACDQPTIADVALYPYTKLAPMGQIDLSSFPNIVDWLARLEGLNGYAALFPGEPEKNYATAETERKQ